MVVPFTERDTGAPILDRILSALRTTLNSLRRAVTNDRLVLVTFPVSQTDVQVRHQLDAPPQSWEVVDRDADVNVWRSSTINPKPREFIILQSSAGPCTVTVRFM